MKNTEKTFIEYHGETVSDIVDLFLKDVLISYSLKNNKKEMFMMYSSENWKDLMYAKESAYLSPAYENVEHMPKAKMEQYIFDSVEASSLLDVSETLHT